MAEFQIGYIVQGCAVPAGETTTTVTLPGPNSYGCEIASRTDATTYETSFTITGTPLVTVNGLTYTPGTNFTSSGSTILFTNPQAIDAVVYVCYRGL